MIKRLFGSFVLIALAGAAINGFRVHTVVHEALKYSNGATVLGHYHMGVVPDAIVYDLIDVDMSTSHAKIMGGFLRFAAKMKDREFREVRMAFRGETKFILDGRHFQKIGQEFSFQNPVHTLRTFPEKLKNPDGTSAFSSWTGGMLGVLNAQLDDLNKVGERWYLEDMS